MKTTSKPGDESSRTRARSLPARKLALLVLAAILLAGVSGCRTKATKQSTDFFTSGSREADQRASQRMAKAEQIEGSGEGAAEKGVKSASKSGGGSSSGSTTNKAAQSQGKLALFDRLGGEQGITAIVEDFTPRLLQDPRVNFKRNAAKKTGLFHTSQSIAWNPAPENLARLKQHFVQFLSLAAGGPAHYEGKDIRSTHANMSISNPEFDAAIGDIKASLDKLQIPNKEQKELLAIIESTRPEIVTQR